MYELHPPIPFLGTSVPIRETMRSWWLLAHRQVHVGLRLAVAMENNFARILLWIVPAAVLVRGVPPEKEEACHGKVGALESQRNLCILFSVLSTSANH